MTPTGKEQNDWKDKLLEWLRDRTRFRVVVVVVMLLAGYLCIYLPLSGKIDDGTRALRREENLRDLARSIEHLRAQYRGFAGRLPKQTDSKEWVAYVLNGIRKFPLRLVTLDCEAPRELGPYRAVALRIELEGAFSNMDALLRWLDSNERLFRIDAVRIAPSQSNKEVLTLQLTVLGAMG